MKRVLTTLAVLVAVPVALSAYCPTCNKGRVSNRGYNVPQNYSQAYNLNPAFSANGMDNHVTQDDQRIARDIRQKIQKSNYAQANNIQMMVEYGKVTFQGKVDSDGTKTQIEEAALTVPGVYNVVNRLEIDEEIMPSNNAAKDQFNYKAPSRFGRGIVADDYDASPAAKFKTGAMQQNGSQAMQDQAYTGTDGELELKVKEKLTTGWFGRKFKDIDYSISNGTVTLDGQVATETDKRTAERLVREIVDVRDVNNNLEVANSIK